MRVVKDCKNPIVLSLYDLLEKTEVFYAQYTGEDEDPHCHVFLHDIDKIEFSSEEVCSIFLSGIMRGLSNANVGLHLKSYSAYVFPYYNGTVNGWCVWFARQEKDDVNLLSLRKAIKESYIELCESVLAFTEHEGEKEVQKQTEHLEPKD